MQSKNMTLERKIPHQRIEVVGFVVEIYIQVIRQNIGDFIKSFQAAIIIYNCFGTTEVGA
jgi:hypothetical protein